jgi:hypothetical protein
MQPLPRNFGPNGGWHYGANVVENAPLASQYLSEPLPPHHFHAEPSDKDIDYALVALLLLGTINDRNWFFDSSASQHFTENPDVFSDLQLADSSISVTSTGGQSHSIVESGTVNVKSPSIEVQYITDVQYVHGLHKNLLSIGQLVDRDCVVIFTSNKCTVLTK